MILSLAVIATIWLSLFVVRLTAPPDLLDNDQKRPAAYMLDAAVNGHWIIQCDDVGDVSSKPPVYTWLGALLILLFGRINGFTLFFPSAIAVLGCCGLTWYYSKRYFGPTAAFLAGVVYVVSPAGAKMIELARTDSLFAFTVVLAAMTAFSAWMKGRGWTWFWLAAAAATLTKGPLGVVLAALGLTAHIWEKRSSPDLRFRGSHWVGIVVFSCVTIGWFALAYWQLGRPVFDKLIGRELVGHANWAVGHKMFIHTYSLPTFYFLSRFLPWSIVTVVGLWRVLKHPASDPEERRFERFLFCSIVAGIIFISFFPHQRGDLIFPLLPAAAMLAGRELVRLFHFALTASFFRKVMCVWVVVLLSLSLYYHLVRGREKIVLDTVAVREVARQVESRFGRDAPIMYANASFGLQFYLGTIKRQVSLEEAAERLAGNEPVLVAVGNLARLRNLMPPGAEIHEVTSWPGPGAPVVTVVSNGPNGIGK
jgi:4-amino-4-deoxy-L-arabinose transferase-like glycosyltransferase